MTNYLTFKNTSNYRKSKSQTETCTNCINVIVHTEWKFTCKKISEGNKKDFRARVHNNTICDLFSLNVDFEGIKK